MAKFSPAILSLLAFSLSGCATARVVTKQPGTGGVIAVSSESNSSAREKAGDLMNENCGSGGYKIIEEGEAVVGSKSIHHQHEYQDATTKTSMFGGALKAYSGGNDRSSQSETNQKTEWRITYKCGK